jgi:hypothetical protein
VDTETRALIDELLSPLGLITGWKHKHPERLFMTNRANVLHMYVQQYWPAIINVPGVWIVGSTAYLLAEGRNPEYDGDLDLVCKDSETVHTVIGLLQPEDLLGMENTYLGGLRVKVRGRQVDIWMLNRLQTIDDVILGYSSNTHAHARVAYEIATGKLTVYPNEKVL